VRFRVNDLQIEAELLRKTGRCIVMRRRMKGETQQLPENLFGR